MARISLTPTIRPERLGFLAALIVLIVSYLLILYRPVWGVPPLQFTLDDAYITFRYAENLAAGHGPVWNPGADPVEGYSSFLWMIVNAGFAAVGIDPEVGSKALSVLGAIALMLILVFAFERASRLVRLTAVGALALSPAFALITAQGMETTFASLLVVATCLFFLRCIAEPTWSALVGHHAGGLLAVATRPDLAAFWLPLTLALYLHIYFRGQLVTVRRTLAVLVLATLLPGAVYFIWRWSYFGYPLPNPFYIKSSAGGVSSSGLDNSISFLIRVAGPYLLLILFLQATAWSRLSRDERYASLSFLGSAFAFLTAISFFDPIQGFLWRYQMPVFPVLLMAFVLVAGIAMPVSSDSTRPPLDSRIGLSVLAVLLFAYPLNTADDVAYEMRRRWQHDRVVAGKALARFADQQPLMLVSEAGALPRFSGWMAVDLLGLVDERIAQQGAGSAYFAELEPTLVATKETVALLPRSEHGVLYDFLRSNGYVFAAAIRKASPKGAITNAQAHLYFVKASHPRAAEIVATLRGLDRVVYVDLATLDAFLGSTGIPVARIESSVSR